MKNPDIEIFGILIHEPVTTLTDLFVTIVCIYAFYRLFKANKKGLVNFYMKYYFALMAIATALGGLLGHAFFDGNMLLKIPGWIFSMVSISFFERASIQHAKPLLKKSVTRFLKIANVIELFLFMGITLYTQDFFFVEVHSAFGLLGIIFPFQAYVFYKTRNTGSRYLLIAIGISCLSALIFMNELAISKWFNHLDVSHVLMAISAYVSFYGAYRLKTLQINENRIN